MSAWNENPEAALRDIELHREAIDEYMGHPDEAEERDDDWPEEETE